jgi:hypothetical protein
VFDATLMLDAEHFLQGHHQHARGGLALGLVRVLGIANKA